MLKSEFLRCKEKKLSIFNMSSGLENLDDKTGKEGM